MLDWLGLFQITDVKHKNTKPINNLSVIYLTKPTKLEITIQQTILGQKLNNRATK
jgi:hypothetical protein